MQTLEHTPEGGAIMRRLLERVFGVRELDARFDAARARRDASSIFEAIALEFGFHVDVDRSAIRRIPESGPIVVIANHPTGGMDAIVMSRLLLSIRDDCRIIAHGWFCRYPGLLPYMYPVDPRPSAGGRRLNSEAIRNAIEWVRGGGMLLTFPAGAVAYLHRRPFRILDPPWHTGTCRIIRSARSSVVPIRVEGRNSALYQIASLIHPRLRVLLLARELLNKRGTTTRLHIGTPIPYERIAQLRSDADQVAFLRGRVHAAAH